MSRRLDGAAPATPRPSVGRSGFAARWWIGWRVALRLARRDAWRGKGRATLVLLLITLPVAAVTSVDVYVRAVNRTQTATARALQTLGASADALVSVGPGSPVTQSPVGYVGDVGRGSVPTRARLQAALPRGTRLVATGTGVDVALEKGAWGVIGPMTIADTHEPLVAGLWKARAGRLPSAPREIAVDSTTARELRLAVGDTVTATLLTRSHGSVRTRVVGIVAPRDDAESVAFPGTFVSRPRAALSWLAITPRPLSWSDVRAVNRAGGVVASRSVLEHPPSFCAPTEICLDARAETTAPDPSAASRAARLAARDGAEAAVVAVLAILLIALLAGPAFAVQLRRRERELGLLGACGGDATTLRRTVLASGVVLGCAGAALGVAVGWFGVWLFGDASRWRPLADTAGTPLGVPHLPIEVLGVAAVGVLAAVTAALVPAEVASRGDVVDTLKGRRALPPVKTRAPILGVVLGSVGVLAMAHGARILDVVVLGVGVAVTVLGLVVLMPFVVSNAARLGRWLPLAPRLAVRDAGRHRMRTAAAACAIAAAACGAVVVSAASTTAHLDAELVAPTYTRGVVLVSADPTEGGGPTLPASVNEAKARRIVARLAPSAHVLTLTDLVPTGSGPTASHPDPDGTVSCLAPTSSSVDSSGADGLCHGRAISGARIGGTVDLLSDPAQLGTLLGRSALADLTRARRALDAGHALVLQPHALDARGRVTLGRATTKGPEAAVEVPAVEVLHGAAPTDVIVGPAALAPGGVLHTTMEASGPAALVLTPTQPDQSDRPTTSDRLNFAFNKANLPASAFRPDGNVNADPGALILGVGAGVTALLALLAGLMVTALSLSDGRADLVTLASVGAGPRTRRRIAASSAGFVSLVGCLTGVALGLLIARVLVPLITTPVDGSPGNGLFGFPWPMIVTVALVIPLLAAVAAGVTTRSRLVLTRRIDA